MTVVLSKAKMVNVALQMCIRCQAKRLNALQQWGPTTGVRRCYSSKSEETSVVNNLKKCIRTTGPLSIAEYMREVLTNPVTGYYMKNDVFGTKGDFITSPEISQMFGELIALWVIHEWMQSSQGHPLQIVELGPGRGTLADDMLRVFKQFKHVTGDSLSLHLVEISPKLSQIQGEKLIGKCTQSHDDTSQSGDDSSGRDGTGVLEAKKPSSAGPYRTAISKTGMPVSWYATLQEVPKEMSCFIAHEFFDALPIHKFQRTDRGWREVLVDVDDSPTGPHHLQFVLAPAPTPASTLYTKTDDSRDHIEVCPSGGVIVEDIGNRIAEDAGMGLIIDYGHDGTKTDTLRGFRNHQLHDVLREPGMADLTADVDFSYFRHILQDKVCTHGPVTQKDFLQAMGIETRLQMLLRGASPDHRQDLLSGYRMLTDHNQMGERFKVFAITPKNQLPTSGQPLKLPPGFSSE